MSTVVAAVTLPLVLIASAAADDELTTGAPVDRPQAVSTDDPEVAAARAFDGAIDPSSNINEEYVNRTPAAKFREKTQRHAGTLEAFARGDYEGQPSEEQLDALNQALGYVSTAKVYRGEHGARQAFAEALRSVEARIRDRTKNARGQTFLDRQQHLAGVNLRVHFRIWRYGVDVVGQMGKGDSPDADVRRFIISAKANHTDMEGRAARGERDAQGYNCLDPNQRGFPTLTWLN